MTEMLSLLKSELQKWKKLKSDTGTILAGRKKAYKQHFSLNFILNVQLKSIIFERKNCTYITVISVYFPFLQCAR